MKFVIFSVLVLIIAGASAFPQTDKQIAAIRAEVAAINMAAVKYDKKTKNIDGISTEGAEATFYSSGKGLKKIVARMYGETFRSTTEIYYRGEEPTFIYQKVSRYNGSIGTGSTPKIARVEETRLYRSGDKTIRILSGKSELKVGEIKFNEKEYELIELADQLKAALDK